MNDYSKWDKLQDSDDEEPEPSRPEPEREELEQFRADQELVEQWLRKQLTALKKTEEAPRPGEPGRPYRPPEPGGFSPPELNPRYELAPYRNCSKEEFKVLSMLIVISHFEEGKTNLDRHPQMLDLVRHNRWLEEDPGTLELLCRVHSQAMRKGKGGGGGPGGAGPSGGATLQDSPEEVRLRNMCLSGINTLAAPKKAGCAGGLLELVTLICTPASDSAKELRKKWQMKEFAKDAIFESLFPDLRKYSEEAKDSGMKEVWVVLAVFVLLIIVVLLILFGPSMPIYAGRPSPAPAPPAPPSGHEPSEL